MTHYSDTVRPASEPVLLAAALIGGTIALFIANLAGIWWMTSVVGLVIGLLPWRARRSFGVAALTAALAWGSGLIWLQSTESVGAVADVVAGIMGFGNHGSIVIMLTLVLAALLAVVGAWMGLALRDLVLPRFQDPFGQF